MSDITPSRLRFAINLGNAVLAHPGERGVPTGITPELSHRLAKRWGVAAEFVTYPAAGKVVATPAANAGILPFWPSIRHGRRPCALPLPISPSREPRW